MKIEVTKSVTVNIGNRNFYKGGYTLSDDTSLEDLNETKSRLETLIEEWLDEDVARVAKIQEEMFSKFS